MRVKIENWKLTESNSGLMITAKVPGDITNELFKSGVISDPYFGLNHKDLKEWLYKDYIYSASFIVDELLEDHQDMFIAFYGVDLFSEIYLNGVLLGKTDNMFKKYTFKISDKIHLGENHVEVHMKSTTKYMETMDTKGYFGIFNLQRILLRKEQCCFGWDWATDLPGYGIWKDVVVYTEEKDRIEDVRCVAGKDKKAVFVIDLNYRYRSYYDLEGNFVEVVNPYTDQIKVSLARTPGGKLENAEIKTIKVVGHKHFITFDNPDAELWWPNGYGSQPLYAYKVELVRNGKTVSEKEGYIAYRSVELVEDVLGDEMLGFKIKINDRNIFVKGSNWVPIDCFTGAIDSEKYVKLITLAKTANYNMLRVWGGGIYENEIFYETCDKLGIMVWQDFMLACEDIPDVEESWTKNMVEECEYQIKRLRNYPSIVYWCGGNEKPEPLGREIQCGDTLINIILRGLVGHLDGTRPYAPQSPCSWTDVANDANSGDSHTSSFEPAIANGAKEYRKLVATKIVAFKSENATMGPPSKQFFERIFPKEDFWPMSEMWHDRMVTNPYAAEKMMFCDTQNKFASEVYGEPKDLDDFIKKGMLIHAEMLCCELDFQRRNKGITSGFMNWMYSDMWPTGTWSVVDYYTEPKEVYYRMKRSCAPVLMNFSRDKDGRTVLFGANDTLNEKEISFEYGQKKTSGEVIWKETGKTVLSTEKSFVMPIDRNIEQSNTYLYVSYIVDGAENTMLYSWDFWSSAEFESDYAVEVSKIDQKKIAVKIKANKFAKSVFINFPDNYGYDYSDNYIDVEAGYEKVVYVSHKDGVNISDVSVSDFVKTN